MQKLILKGLVDQTYLPPASQLLRLYFSLWIVYILMSYIISIILMHVELILNSVIPLHPLPFSQIYTYIWVKGSVPPNGTERQGFCVRSTVHLSKALSPAFVLKEYTSKDYSTWTESRWKNINVRIFLVASHDLEVNPFQPSEILVHSILKLENHQKLYLYQ